MEEEQAMRGHGGGDGSNSILGHSSLTTTFAIPLTRYTTHLITSDHHRIFLGECADSRSDDEDEETEYYSGRSIIGGNCSYSKPILVLDVVWNLAFVLIAVAVLLSAFKERPSVPLRLWLCGYTLQSLLHVGLLFVEYRTRKSRYGFDDRSSRDGLSLSWRRNCLVKRLQSTNIMISSVWWVFGFYWIVTGGQPLLQDSPRLYWITMVFLAFDVFFIIFCVGMACVIFFVLCCCIPVVAFAYAMTIREGASEDDIRTLPRYRFRPAKKQELVGPRLESDNSSHINELVLHSEDSECCICLSLYVEGTELYTLPCSHHFHCGCISKWLRINSTCPLCKFNILRSDTLV